MSLGRKLTYALVALLAASGGIAWWWFHRPPPPYQVKDPGIYPFQGLSADGKSLKTGFIDADGKVLIPPQWDGLASEPLSGQLVIFNEGLCGIRKDGKFGYIDTGGHLVIAPQFDDEAPFIEGMARVRLGNTFGYIDKTGQYVINPQFQAAGDFHEGLAAVRTDAGWGFINKTGSFVIRPHFPDADVDGFSNGLAAVCQGNCGYIDHAGNFVIRPQFEQEQSFSDKMAAVRMSDKWGYINRSGKIVINPQFDNVAPFINNLAAVVISGRTGTINKSGKYVLNPGEFNFQLFNGKFYPFDLEQVSTNDGIGLIARDGKWVVSPTTALTDFGPQIGKILYGKIGNQDEIPISMSGKVLAGNYKGAMLNGLQQDLQDESNAIQIMHAIVAAEAAYSTAYPAKGFADSLDKLGPSASGLPDENHAGLISFDLPGEVKSNYKFSITIPAGTATAGTNFNYLLTAEAAAGHFGRTLCADSSQTIHYAPAGQACSTQSPNL